MLLNRCVIIELIVSTQLSILKCAERARALAELVGGEALSLTELETFKSETGMVLANTTSMGMQPNFDETPLSKVIISLWFLYLISFI